jgi:hypothetical protein
MSLFFPSILDANEEFKGFTWTRGQSENTVARGISGKLGFVALKFVFLLAIDIALEGLQRIPRVL